MLPTEIHFFGGQGSQAFYEEPGLSVVQADARSSLPAQELLRRCHHAFRDEATVLSLLDPDEYSRLLASFRRPEDLCKPPSCHQSDPIIEGTTLCLFQLLRYLARTEASSTFQEAFAAIHETVGFCSGALAAVVVAASPTIEDFLRTGVEAYRLAFWIGYRSRTYSRSFFKNAETEKPWSHVILGWSRAETQRQVALFNTENPLALLHVAAVSRDNYITISGPSSALEKFLVRLPGHCSSRPVHVHALYHAGEELRCVVDAVLQDVERRDIGFPTMDALRHSVRNTANGSCITRETPRSQTLVHLVLEMILIQPIEWLETSATLLQELQTNQDLRPTACTLRALFYGPFAPLMMSGLPKKSLPSHIEMLDVSHESRDTQMSCNYGESSRDIAIVGTGVDFPNGTDTNQFWGALENGMNFVQEVPGSRFDIQDVYVSSSSEKASSRKMTTKHGNFIKNPWAFDNMLFNISPREAKSMDPQQRVLLQCAHHAMENAGYVPDSTKCFDKEHFGCYVGVATGDYVESLRDDIDVYSSPGNLRAFLSGRISYIFDLSGPSVVVDTACSSSMVAIHQACRALIAGDCNAALAGGVNIMCGPDMYLSLSRAHFLSSTGQCKPFDAAADGYCRAEGCGMFVLKRLSDAVAENDRILGVIKNTEINQSGNASSITHPHAETQQKLFDRLLTQSKIIPQTINVVEAHGTGTQAGDPVEFESLRNVLARGRTSSNPLHISSIKGNIGHAEAASGAAGLAKLLMMLSKEQIPTQVGLETLNPKILPLDRDHIIIPKQLTHWPRIRNLPRRALLNNFGAAGSNASLLLEEYIPPVKDSKARVDRRSSYVFALSAKTTQAFQQLRLSLCTDGSLRQNSVQDLAYTSTARRIMSQARAVMVVKSTEHLFECLETLQPPPQSVKPAVKSVVFTFSGQGGHYLGMGRELFDTVPSFRSDVLECDAILLDAGHISILPIVQAPPASELHLEKEYGIQAWQCAVFVIEYALARLWMSWNIHPNVLLGHSLGEYAAFVIAGVLSLSDALLLVAFRASLMAKLCASDSTGMLAVNASAKEVDRLLNMKQGGSNDLSVACRNSPSHTVVSGPLDQIVLLRTVLKQMSIKSKQLDVPFAYHSPAMHPIKEPLDRFTSKIQLSPPKIPLGLNLFGRMHSLGDLDHRYFSSQSLSPVRFQELVGDSFIIGELDSTAVIEMGPHPTTLPLISAALPQTAVLYLASLQRTEDSWVSMSKALTELTLRDSKINWREVYHGTDCGLVDFPSYPFAQDEFRVPYRAHHSGSKALGAGNDLADKQQQNRYSLLSSSTPTLSSGHGSVYRSTVATIAPLIDGHRVTGLSLCPASVYVELALEAAQCTAPLTGEKSYVIQEITFPIPLVGDAQSTKQIDVTITATDTPGELRFQITSREMDSEEEKAAYHCKGLLKSQMNDHLRTGLSNGASFIKEEKRPSATAEDVPCTVVNRRMLYETIFPRVVAYSPKYQSIQRLEISDSGMEGRGTFRLQRESLIEKCVSQPVFADTLLHAAGFLANCSVSASNVCICTKVEEATLLTDSIDSSETYSLYSFISHSGASTILGKSFAFDPAGRVVASIQGMHFRRLPLANFKHHLQSSLGERSDLPPSRLQSQHGAIVRSGSNERVSQPSSVPRSKILQIIADLTGITDKRIIDSMTFDELGIDSMMMIEFVSELKVQLPQIDGVPQSAILSCSSLADLEACLGASPASSLSEQSLPDLVYTDTSNVSSAVARSPQNVTVTNSEPIMTAQILDAIAQVTGVRRELVKEESDLEALGLDSMMSIELLQAFEAQHGVRVSSDAFASCKSPRDVEMLTQSAKISAGTAVAVERTLPGDDELSRSLNLLQSGPEERAPVYLIHDGSGSSSAYGRLTLLGRNMYGVSSPIRADAKRSPQTIQEMAAEYTTLLDTSGPIILGGWSFGGVVAFEMARQLRTTNHNILGVILIDSPCPTDHVPLPAPIIEHICRGQLRGLREPFSTHAAMLGRYEPAMLGDDPAVVLLRNREAFDSRALCGVDYPFVSERGQSRSEVVGWEELTGQKIEVLDIPGNHFETFGKEHITEASVQIRKAIDTLERKSFMGQGMEHESR